MSAYETSNGHGDPVLQPFIDMWTRYLDQANEVTSQFVKLWQDGANPRNYQQRWSEAMTKSTDAYMRSPAFLRTMKQNLDAVIKVKLHTDDLARETARNLNVPMASDISGLFERIHSVEEVIVERLKRIEERLGAIEEGASRRKAIEQSLANP